MTCFRIRRLNFSSLHRVISSPTYRNRCWCLFIAFLMSCSQSTLAVPAFADTTPPQISTDEIVTRLISNNARRTATLRGYTGLRTYEVDYRGFPTGHKHAQMVIRVDYKAPHQKTFSIVTEDGSKLLFNHVLHKLIETEQETNGNKGHADSDLSRENYQFDLLGTGIKNERNCYILRVIPKHNNKLLYRGNIWVDMQEFAVVHIEAQPARSPSFWISEIRIEHDYSKVGAYWLPVRNHSTSRVRFGGTSVLTIDYKDYEIDSGQKQNVSTGTP